MFGKSVEFYRKEGQNDKERKIQTNSLRPEMLGVPDSKKEEVTSAKQHKKKGV